MGWSGGRTSAECLRCYIHESSLVILLLLSPTRIHTFSPTPTSLWSCLFASLVENPPPPSLSLLSGSFPFHLMMFYAKALACNDFIPRIVRTTGEQGKMCRFTSRISDGIHGLHTCARSAPCSRIIASRRPYTSCLELSCAEPYTGFTELNKWFLYCCWTGRLCSSADAQLFPLTPPTIQLPSVQHFPSGFSTCLL